MCPQNKTTQKPKSPVSKSMFLFLKLIGMCPFTLDKIDIIRRSKTASLYSTILIVGYTLCYCRVVVSRISIMLPRETNMLVVMDFIGLGLDYWVIMVVWFYALVYQNELRCILKHFITTKREVVLLGMTECYDDFTMNLRIFVISLNLFFFVLYVVDHALLYHIKEFEFGVWLPFNLPRCVSINMVGIYLYALKTIQTRFQFINLRIENFPNNFSLEEAPGERNFGKNVSNPIATADRLRAFGKLHRNLRNLVTLMNNLFALPLLIALMMQFTQLIVNIYMLLIYISNGNYCHWNANSSMSIVLGWLIIRLIQTLCIIDVCETMSQTANRIGNYLHTMWVMRRPQCPGDVVKILSLECLQQTVKIQLYGSIVLNNSMLFK
ncbi:gustatory receptor 8CTE, partial [Diachasma alloeum]